MFIFFFRNPVFSLDGETQIIQRKIRYLPRFFQNRLLSSFLSFNSISTFSGYLMLNPSLWKNSSSTLLHIAGQDTFLRIFD